MFPKMNSLFQSLLQSNSGDFPFTGGISSYRPFAFGTAATAVSREATAATAATTIATAATVVVATAAAATTAAAARSCGLLTQTFSIGGNRVDDLILALKRKPAHSHLLRAHRYRVLSKPHRKFMPVTCVGYNDTQSKRVAAIR